MASETGHAKNVANFENLISIVQSLGAAYNPPRANLKLPALTAIPTAASGAVSETNNLGALKTAAFSERKAAFDDLGKLVSRIILALELSDADALIGNAARALARKLKGGRAGEKPEDDPATPDVDESKQTHSVSQMGYVGKRGITYTRYADDLSFSGYHPNKVCKIFPIVKKIIENEYFQINEEKTRVAGASRAKKVTGLVINEKSFGIGRERYKLLRAKIHHLASPHKHPDEKLVTEVQGWLAYLNSVDKFRFKKAKKYIDELLKLNPESLLKNLR